MDEEAPGTAQGSQDAIVEPPKRRERQALCLDQRTYTQIVAKVIPVLLCGATGFATWVYIAQLCVNFIIHTKKERALGAGLISAYLVLFLLMASCFFRVVFTKAGYIPRPKDDPEKANSGEADPTASADMFVCEAGGYPRWCKTCEVIKPDRSHHSRDSGRCVYKMDHFCPWVGGMIGFTRYKFFLQFVTYTALYCGYICGTLPPFLRQRLQYNNDFPVTWIITLVLAAFFTIFMVPFSITHAYYTLRNITTNESFDHKHRTYLFNILVETSEPQAQAESSQRSSAPRNPSSSARVVVSSDPGDNPWNLGWRRNWTEVMGNNVWDWFLPIHGSRGDGIRFDYDPKLVEKLQTKARRVIMGKHAEEDDAQLRSLAAFDAREKEGSTLESPDEMPR